MPMYDCQCETCGEFSEYYLTLSEIPDWIGVCHCGGKVFRMSVPLKAPAIHADANNYHAQIAKMKRNSKEHFVKSGEMDQIRHKHGKAFDDALVGAAAKRIRDGNVSDD